MSTNFHIEGWRKLYKSLPPSWLQLPLSARGLGDEMIKYVDDDGLFAIRRGRPLVDEVCRIMSAHSKERKRVGDDLSELLEDGYLLLVEDGLRIKTFVEAQDRTPSAKRMADMRKRKRNSDVTSDVTGDGRRDVTGDATSDGTVRERSDGSDPIRSDPIRSDPKVSQPASPAAPAKATKEPRAEKSTKPKPPPHPRFREVLDSYFTAFESFRGEKPIFGSLDGKRINELLAKCGGDADRAIRTIHSAFTGDPFLAKSATIESIAANPSKYIGTARTGPTGQPLAPKVDARIRDADGNLVTDCPLPPTPDVSNAPAWARRREPGDAA